jgi:Flp pilus assembly protein TadB
MSGATVATTLLAAAVLLDPAPRVAGVRIARLTSGPATRAVLDTTRLLPVLTGAALGTLAGVACGVPAGLLLGPVTAIGGGLAARKALARGRPPPRGEPLRLAAGWDLLAACLSAGLPVPTAVRAVAPDMPGTAAQALSRTAELMALGADPVQAWAPAMEHPDTAPLARGARRTARSGTALAAVAGALADDVRAGAADLAESQAQRAAVLVSGPLGLCFLPAFVCLGVVPVVIGLAEQLMRSW